jgi:hypothetical protein
MEPFNKWSPQQYKLSLIFICNCQIIFKNSEIWQCVFNFIGLQMRPSSTCFPNQGSSSFWFFRLIPGPQNLRSHYKIPKLKLSQGSMLTFVMTVKLFTTFSFSEAFKITTLFEGAIVVWK